MHPLLPRSHRKWCPRLHSGRLPHDPPSHFFHQQVSDRSRSKLVDRQKYRVRQTNGYADKQTVRQTNRWAYKQTDSQADKQTGIQTDRQVTACKSCMHATTTLTRWCGDRGLTFDSRVFVVATVVNIEGISGTLDESGLSTRASHIVQHNGTISLTVESTCPSQSS